MIIDYSFSEIDEILLYELKYKMIKRLQNNIIKPSWPDRVLEDLCKKGKQLTLKLLLDMKITHRNMDFLLEVACVAGKIPVAKVIQKYRKNNGDLYIPYRVIHDRVFNAGRVSVLMWMMDEDVGRSSYSSYACKLDSIRMMRKICETDFYAKGMIINSANCNSTRIVKWLCENHLAEIKKVLETDSINYHYNLFKHIAYKSGFKLA